MISELAVGDAVVGDHRPVFGARLRRSIEHGCGRWPGSARSFGFPQTAPPSLAKPPGLICSRVGGRPPITGQH